MISQGLSQRKATVAAILAVAVIVLAVASAILYGRRPGNTLPSADASLSLDASEWDFGAVDVETPILKHAFHVTNRSREVVSIRPLKLGCNCLSVECPERIEPGASAAVSFDVEVRRREGRFATRATLETSDRTIPIIEFGLAFYGEPGVDVDPTVIHFSGTQRGATLERELTVVTRIEPDERESPPLPQIEVEQTLRGGISVDHIDTKITSGLLSTRGGADLVRVAHRFSVRVDSRSLVGDEPALRAALRVTAEAGKRDLEKVVPIELSFAHHALLGGPTRLTITRGKRVVVPISSRDGRPFRLIRVDASDAALQIALPESSGEESKRQQFSVEASEHDTDGEGPTRARLDVYCSISPDDPYCIEALVLP